MNMLLNDVSPAKNVTTASQLIHSPKAGGETQQRQSSLSSPSIPFSSSSLAFSGVVFALLGIKQCSQHYMRRTHAQNLSVSHQQPIPDVSVFGSKPIILSKLITEPSHSILTQSYDSRLRLDSRRPVNGDGFGVGWYTEAELGPDPCVFTSTLPAWNCVNLERLAPKTASRLIFAHVRATTEGSLAENNCHPFQFNTLMWMHNGNIGAWKYVKRPLADSLRDRWFLGVKGGTDSEWAFALFLDFLEKEGVNPSAEPEGGFDSKLLRRAMKKTVAQINAFVNDVPAEHTGLLEDVETRSLLNFAVTDGHSVVVTRYVSSKTDAAASLYYSSGTAWVEGKEKGEFKMERQDKASDVVLVASEPLTFERHSWLTVPTNTIMTISKQSVEVKPIKDEFYDDTPEKERSTGFAKSKGLVAKAPGGGADTPTPNVPTPILHNENVDVFNEKVKSLQNGVGH